MIGRDFSRVGIERNIFQKIKNGTKQTFTGPVKIHWLDSTNFAIVDSVKSIHFQTIYGHITSTIVASTKQALRIGNNLLEAAEGEGGAGDSGNRQLLMNLDVIANDISMVPGTTKIAIADARKFVTFMDTDDWAIEDGFGKNVNPKKKQDDSIQANAIASFTIDGQIFVCVVDTDHNCVTIASDDGMIDLVVGNPGGVPGTAPGTFDEPCSISCCKPHSSHYGEDEHRPLERDPFTPPWFLGSGCTPDEVETMLLAEPVYGGKFYVCARGGMNNKSGVPRGEDDDDDRRGQQEGRRYGLPKVDPPPDSRLIPTKLYDLYFISNPWTEPMEITQRLIICRPNPEAASAKAKEVAEATRRSEKASMRLSKRDQPEVVVDPSDERERKRQGRVMMGREYQLAASTGTQIGRSFSSLWELVRNETELERKTDRRPFVWVAVGERTNRRVQIMRYFWTTSEVYRPMCETVYSVGGYREQFVPIKYPTSIDFSSSGELAICDTGLKTVYLLTPYMTLIKAFQVPFRYEEQVKISRSYQVKKPHRKSLAMSMEAYLLARDGDGGGGGGGGGAGGGVGEGCDDDESDEEDDRSLNDAGAGGVSFKTVTTVDEKPVSVAFAPDGKLAVGYDSGAVAIYPVCKLASVGDFHVLTTPAMKTVLSFCSYVEAKNLRGCCKFFHDYTRDLRFHWEIHPLRRRSGDFMLTLFVKYARSGDNDLVTETTRRQELANFRDSALVCLCPRYVRLKPCTGGGRTGRCVQGLSHHPINIDYYEYSQSKFVMELRTFLLAASELFDQKFVWLHELYIEKLFFAYSFDQYLQYRADTNARVKCGNMQIKTVPFTKTSRVIDFKGYLEVMTVLEEQYVGASLLDDHPLFNPAVQAKKQVAMGDPSAVVTSSLADVRLSYDALKQYDRAIDIPPVKPKRRRQQFHSQEVAEKKPVDPGLATTHSTVERQAHIMAFWQYTQNSTALIQQLFKTEEQKRLDT